MSAAERRAGIAPDLTARSGSPQPKPFCSDPKTWGLGQAFPRHEGLSLAAPLTPLTSPGSVQGQVGWSSEQPSLVEDVPAYGRGVGTR